MRIKDLEHKSGVPRTTIHFYLRHGLLHPPQKTGRTMAYYDETHLARLRDIQLIKGDRRMPLSFLKEKLAELSESSDGKPSRTALSIRETATTTKAKERKKQKIVETAIRIFSQKGYHRAKVQDITKALDISTGTFYIYFQNKRDLFVEVVDHVIRSILGDATREIVDERDLQQRMIVRGRVFYENYSKYSEILNLLRAEMASEDKWPEEKIRKAYHDLTKPVIRDLQTGIDSGVYRQVDPDLLAYALTGIIEVMSLRMMIDEKYSYEDIISFIVDFVMNGVSLNRGKEHT